MFLIAHKLKGIMMKKLLLFSLLFTSSVFAKPQPGDTKATEKMLTRASKHIDEVLTVHGKVIEKLKPFDQKRSIREFELIEKEVAHIIRGFELNFSFFTEFFAGDTCQALKDHPFVWYYSELQRSNSTLTRVNNMCKKHIKLLNKKLAHKKLADDDKVRYERCLKQVENTTREATDLIIALSHVEKFIKLSDSYVREKQLYSNTLKPHVSNLIIVSRR